MENKMIELVARTIDVPLEELVEWLESRQKVEHQEKPPLSPWLSRKAAAEYASVSTDTIDKWCASGLIEKRPLLQFVKNSPQMMILRLLFGRLKILRRIYS